MVRQADNCRISNDVRLNIPEALKVIEKYGFAAPEKRRGRELWIPDWSQSDRARKIIASPGTTSDKAAREARAF